MKIAIIGAGINGLSVAVNLLETIPGITVYIYTAKITPNTTGDVAAGLWYPYAIDENDSRLKSWLLLTFNYLVKMITTDSNHHKYGIFSMNIYKLNEDVKAEYQDMHEIFDHNHILTERELKRFPSAKSGIVCSSFIIEPSKFLQYLLNKFINLGGRIIMQSVHSFDEIQLKKNFPIIINCTGLGSRDLCNDLNIYPLRGQTVRIEAPWIKFAVLSDSNYIIPQSDGVVILGGTKQENDWNVLPDDNDTKYILDGCANILQGLKNPKVLSVQVGLRPRRNAIRLEIENKTNAISHAQYKIIHNYGHGGSGFTLFWGCSVHVVQMVSDVILLGRL